MSKVVVDTDVLIDVPRGRAAARAFLLRVTEHAIPCCSAISAAQIHAGMPPQERDRTGALLDSLVRLDVTRPVAELAGRFKRRERARRLELADCLIAATAVLEVQPTALDHEALRGPTLAATSARTSASRASRL